MFNNIKNNAALTNMEKIRIYFLYFIKTISICFVFALTITESYSQVYDYQALRQRVVDGQRTGVIGVGTMDSWVASQNTNGSWSDARYGNLSPSIAVTDNHVYRLWNIAAACSKAGHVKYNDTNYKDAVKKGLQFWYGSNTVDPNWWFNKIYFPQKLGEILLFMREFDGFIPQTTAVDIDEPEILSLFQPTALNDVTSHGTGANAIDIGVHYVYRGLLMENSTILEGTRNRLEAILAENIEGDMVYQDHGPQIMIASYGWVFCNGLMRLASYLADSPAAFDTNAQNFGTVLDFIRNTQASSARGGSWDFSVMGRSISRNNALNANMNYLQSIADYIDPANATEYLDILSRLKGTNPPDYNVREFNKHYWASDYTQHARSGYLFTVRNTSTRTVEAESGNGENLKANYLSYGANFISIDGDEYTNIMPVWDWSMIPGTTFPYVTSFPPRSNWGFNFGTTTFVGGVSDGVHGASVLNLDEAGIQAKKSWFFFDDEIVCLGAGIVDSSNRNVRTTINQTWMNAASYSCVVGSASETMQSVSSVTYNDTNLKYLRNNKFGYYFPNQGNVKYTMKSQSGTWNSINSNGSTDNESGYVFSLWLDHGNNPSNANYSYIIVPGIDSAIKAQNYDANAIDIVENTVSIQAVYHKTLDVLQVIFHQAGTVTFEGKSVTVNNPCALMFKNGTLVTVSNPSQSHTGVSVTINVNGNDHSKIVLLPTSSNMKGASVTVDFGDVLSVNDPLAKSGIKLYPNPTQGPVHFKVDSSESITYDVSGLDGKVIASGRFVGEVTVDMSNYANGLYIVTLKDKQWVTTQKIIKY